MASGLLEQQDADSGTRHPSGQQREPRKIRFTSAEWQIIAERARACGKPPARYVRETSLGATPRPRNSQTNAELIRELGRIGMALTHLAASAKERGMVGEIAAIERTLAEVLAVVRRLA